MDNWREYLHSYKGIDREAYLLEKKIEKINKRAKILPITAIICFILSCYFLRNFMDVKSFYFILPLGFYPYIVGFLFLLCISKKKLFLFSFTFFISNIILFLKYFVFAIPSDLFKGIIDGKIYILEYGSVMVNDLQNVKIGISLLLISSIFCIGICLIESKINKIISEINFIIYNHKQ